MPRSCCTDVRAELYIVGFHLWDVATREGNDFHCDMCDYHSFLQKM